MENRQLYIINKRKFIVNILPEFKAVFSSSKSESSSIDLVLCALVTRERSNFLLRSPRNKRPKLEERNEVEIIQNDDDIEEI